MNVAVLALLIPLAAIFGIFFMPFIVAAFALVLRHRERVRKDGSTGAWTEEETRLMQDIHKGLERMEARIEALETIMFDQERKERVK